MKKNRTYIALTGVLVFALAAIVFAYTSRIPTPAQTAQPTPMEAPATSSISFSIQSLYEHKQIEATSGETVLQVLRTLDTEDPQLQLSTKEYKGLGTLVDGMHGLTNGTDKKYWQYKVNGVMPQIGADGYKLKNGDAIEWFFGLSQE